MSDRLKMGRRGLLKALGLGPAALPFAGRAIAESAVINQSYMEPAGALAGGVGSQLLSRWTAVGMVKSVWQSFAKSREEREREWRQTMMFRVGGFDPDIVACKSWSHAFAARQQFNRDMAMQDYLRDSGKKLYGWKDGWEDA